MKIVLAGVIAFFAIMPGISARPGFAIFNDGRRIEGDLALDAAGNLNALNLGIVKARYPFASVKQLTFTAPAGLTPLYSIAPTTTLPSPWQTNQLGEASLAGSVNLSGNALTILGAGADTPPADTGYFVNQPFAGNTEIIARLVNVQDVDPLAYTGLMMRNSTASEATYAGLLLVGGKAATLRYHRSERQAAVQTPFTNAAPVCWLKLSRVNDTVTGSLSDDGRNWMVVGQQQISLATTVQVGLVTSSHNSSILCRSIFDSITVAAAQVETGTEGILFRRGSFLTAAIQSANDTAIRFINRNRPLTVPTLDAARLIFAPLTPEQLAHLTPGRRGLVLATGDFCEGTLVTMQYGRVKLNSPLFGYRYFTTPKDVRAIALRDPVVAPATWEVFTVDGSHLLADTVKIEVDQLVIEDTTLGSIRIGFNELRELKRIR